MIGHAFCQNYSLSDVVQFISIQFQLATDLEKDVTQLKSENENLKRKHKVYKQNAVYMGQLQVVLKELTV